MSNNMHSFFLLGAIFLLIIAGLRPASAQRVAPLIVDMSVYNEKSDGVVTVDNTSAAPLFIETELYRRQIHISGKENLTLVGGGNFVIFPPQAVIAPKSQQTFRLTWANQPLDATQSYHMRVRSLPLPANQVLTQTSQDDVRSLDTRLSNAQIGVDVFVAVHASPKEATVDLHIKDIRVTNLDQTTDITFLTLNRGRRYASLKNASLFLKDKSGKQIAEINGAELLAHNPSTLIPANGERRFNLILPRIYSSEIATVAIHCCERNTQ